jgi:peptide/nickel transport system permease protein
MSTVTFDSERRPVSNIRPAPFTHQLKLLVRLVKKPAGAVGFALIGLLIFTAIFAEWLAPFDPLEMASSRLTAPGGENLLGTDEFGRDILSRIIFGSRISLKVGLISVLIAALLGGPLGLVSGYFGGWLDDLVMRLMDILYSFPGLILAMLITAMLGPSLTNTMIAIGIVYAPGFSRVVRGPVLAQKGLEYIEASRALGASSARIIFAHVLPNVIAPVIVATTVSFSFALLSEAALSYLGLGAQPPEPSWGTMLLTGKRFMEVAPWTAIYPGIAIALAVLGSNLLGDALRDVLDPRLKR